MITLGGVELQRSPWEGWSCNDHLGRGGVATISLGGVELQRSPWLYIV